MRIDRARARAYLRDFDFATLFREELGWEAVPPRTPPLPVTAGGHTYRLTPVATMAELRVFVCPPAPDGAIPDQPTRLAIEKTVTEHAYEHILIFGDAARRHQLWQWAKRETGRPTYRAHRYDTSQSGEALIQKIERLAFALDEMGEDGATITAAAAKAKAAFDVETKITKRFYERFKKEHERFLLFVNGIQAKGDREWYASLMLNRLMFVYFIQKKGFLDGNPSYLRDKLAETPRKLGKDQYHSFYRSFLLRLFHDGLATPTTMAEHAAIEPLLGKVPYLNGGLFDVHELERAYDGIQIADDAFRAVFDFFDEWQWHLDERPNRSDREINPDVLGYIFEKYINQKQMGAYYTKEDITEYIGKNTIIPYVLDAAARRCAIAFQRDGPLWGLLRADPDRYLYPAVRHGVDEPLPPEIAAGLDDVSRRGGWNRPAPDTHGLPTETWREHVARRQRCHELRRKLAAGEVHAVNDLITDNLDIRQFAQDVIEQCEGPELLRAIWRTLAGHTPDPNQSNEQYEPGMSVLDPTCGSGAFLFAALNILEPLYEACLDRMQDFVDSLAHESGPHSPQKYRDFRRVLEQLAKHPNRRYFSLKSIVLNNLYGVDIMEEAVEICKLRLFLKLVAQVDDADQIEPLPDIDFNIRAGNTLVGFATEQELARSATTRMDFFADLERIRLAREVYQAKLKQFRQQQTVLGGQITPEDKLNLRASLQPLQAELDTFLARRYGHALNRSFDMDVWRNSHRPFHWYVEFPDVIDDGGFSVIIGNPPWKEYAAVRKDYTVLDYVTERSGNLHALCTERAIRIRSTSGALSFIVQLPLTNSSRMESVRRLLQEENSDLWVIPLDDRPGKLFDGLQHCRSAIFISLGQSRSVGATLRAAGYQRWSTAARQSLFPKIDYTSLGHRALFRGHFPKYASALYADVFRRIAEKKTVPLATVLLPQKRGPFIFYQEATQYWVKATTHLPYYAKNGAVGSPAHGRYLYFSTAPAAQAAGAVLNSSLFYLYFIAYGDCFHLSDHLASNFPVTQSIVADPRLSELNQQLMADLERNSERKSISTTGGDTISYAEYFASRSKPIIDEIDRALAEHYGFTDEELDFIINYDIKYRLGRDGGEGEE